MLFPSPGASIVTSAAPTVARRRRAGVRPTRDPAITSEPTTAVTAASVMRKILQDRAAPNGTRSISRAELSFPRYGATSVYCSEWKSPPQEAHTPRSLLWACVSAALYESKRWKGSES